MAGGKISSDPGVDETAPATSLPGDPDPANALVARTERYRLGAELGRGGMGRVVEAFDTQLGRTVALKEILPRAGSNLTRRFAREVQLTARLEHPSIVPLYDAGVMIDGRPYYVMRRVTGRPFDELIQRARDLGERLTLLPELLAAIDAVAHAHRRGVIHRDLKPGNILVGELGETVVIDWGLAKAIGETDPDDGQSPLPADSLQTQIGAVFGTPGFMAPEQARGEELDPGGDVYALGACLYQLLAGKAPVSGTSATEIIEKTHRHDIVPLARVAPAAPPELVAIVEKALAFDVARRYPDAGALAEDVRRFLDGQLVAAHRYTRRQRLARFARRHRAPLAVAALAMVAVAVLSWLAVRRIVRERDAAHDATELAVAARSEAEVARDRERDRSDALLVTQARSLLATNPTEAVAVLKLLAPSSRRLDEARAIAQAAALAGVAWAMEGPQATAIPWLDASGQRLALQGRGGATWVYDLAARRLVRSRTFPHDVLLRWLTAGRLLVFARGGAPQLWDPSRDTLDELAAPAANDFEVSDSGRFVLLRGVEKGVALVDVDTREVRRLAVDRAIADVELAPDASWLALHDGATVLVLDAEGNERLRYPTKATVQLRAADDHRIAISQDVRTLVECSFAPTAPATSCVQIATPPKAHIGELRYLGRELYVRLDGELHAWNGTRIYRVSAHGTSQLLAAAGQHLLVSPDGGNLHVHAPYGRTTIALPSAPLHARIAAHRGAPRIVVVGANTPAILVVELAALEPTFVAATNVPRASFADDATLLLHGTELTHWRWLDVTSRTLAPFGTLNAVMPALLDLDTRGQAILRAVAPAGNLLVRARRGHALERMASYASTMPFAGWGLSVTGDATIYGTGDARVLGKLGAAQASELFTLDGPLVAIAELGPLRIGAISTTGELLRGNVETAQYERHRLPGATSIGRDVAGRTLVAADRNLFAWDRDVVELGDLGASILQISPVAGGAAVVLRDYSVVVVEPGATLVTHRILEPSSSPPMISRDGRLALGTNAQGQVTVVELPARTSWRLPSWGSTPPSVHHAIAPSARQFAQIVPGGVVLRALPDAGADLHAFLETLTNATVDASHSLVWPWQTRQP